MFAGISSLSNEDKANLLTFFFYEIPQVRNACRPLSVFPPLPLLPHLQVKIPNQNY